MGGITVRLASANAHKAAELERSLPGWTIEPLAAAEYPEETGETFYDNALLKARFGRELAPGDWVVADDSGIEVEALGGLPGVHSSRWAEPGTHLVTLLRKLESAKNRRARYVCELVALSPDGSELRGRGTLEGTIAEEPRGSEGFGYDPIFIPEGETKTVAELGDAWKSEHSHRARAAQALGRAVS